MCMFTNPKKIYSVSLGTSSFKKHCKVQFTAAIGHALKPMLIVIWVQEKIFVEMFNVCMFD
jgi:hypothetical protein